MKILSLNVRGFGGKTKQNSLRSLFLFVQRDMILLEETMCSSFPALFAFSKLLPKWEFCATSASGLSGGLLTAWNPLRVKCGAFETLAGILVKVVFHGMNFTLDAINYYGPYRNRVLFWDNVLRGGLLSAPNLILGGDLNLTMNASESRGHKAILDPLAPHFKHFFDSAGLLDIAPHYTGPTWKNGRVGDEGIYKRLDHFLLSFALIPFLKRHGTWIQPADISDHLPICLEWNKSLASFNYPFKFN